MQDELDHLRDTPDLFALLDHYAQLARPDRQAWQDRLMALDARGPAPLTRLHGDLIASGWLEQNTGLTPGVKLGTVPACYRVTPAGLRSCGKRGKMGNKADKVVLANALGRGTIPI